MAIKEIYHAQVMMVGGRRCGKTSVLAAMKENFDKAFENDGITTVYGNMATLQTLEDKREELREYFDASNRAFVPDANPTAEKMTYQFLVGVQGKQGSIGIDIIDYPGEYLRDTQHADVLQKSMRQSQCIVIAIDTPHMLEEEGRFNERKNYSTRICEMLKMAVINPQTGIPYDDPKLFLFVPLKCEKYSRENRMDEVVQAVQKFYKPLLDVLKLQSDIYEVAVTPIFTLGRNVARFSHFERDLTTGDIIINEKSKTPAKAVYVFLNDSKGPIPQYCEQPIAYLLAYLMQQAANIKKQRDQEKSPLGKIVTKINETFFNAIASTDLFEKRNAIRKKIKTEEDGYRILQDPVKWL